MTETPCSKRLNASFYWECVIFKVEDEYFSVPKTELVKTSPVFLDMFTVPAGKGNVIEGSDMDHPIVLEGYKKQDFASLLKVLYPSTESLLSKTDTVMRLTLAKDEWISVLTLSNIWCIDKIREYAIFRLSNDFTMSAIEKVLLGRQHKVLEWFKQGIDALTDPTSYALPIEELKALGWETTARVLSLKDREAFNTRLEAVSKNGFAFSPGALICPKASGGCDRSVLADVFCCASCNGIIDASAFLVRIGDGCDKTSTRNKNISIQARKIKCAKCLQSPFGTPYACVHCGVEWDEYEWLWVQPTWKRATKQQMIEESFGEEIRSYGPSRT